MGSELAEPFMGHEVAGDVEIDWRSWPVVTVTPPRHALTDAQMQEFIDAWHRHVCDKTDAYALVLDLREAAQMKPSQRRMLTEAMEGGVDHLNACCRGNAMVFDSVLLRGILTAILWVVKPEYPTKVFNSVPEALAWAQEQTHRAIVDSAS